MKYADLHLHTRFSDGTYTVPELLEKAKARNLDCIAITDHDTVEALAYLKKNIREPGLEVIPGVELTADYEGKEVHILGYFVDYENKEFLKELALIKQARVERIYEMVDKLKSLGMSINTEDVFRLSDVGTIGRLHLARAMFSKGCVCSTQEAFNKYIGDNGPAYVGRFRLSPAQAIKLIAEAGGVAVLAHPYCLPDQNLIFTLIDLGLDGLEVYYPEHSAAQIKNYLEIAKKHGLLVTGGSDCHGFAKPTELIGKIKLPYELVEEMRLRL
jgi:3',5'-nucleoside bisphosphate phosphatase